MVAGLRVYLLLASFLPRPTFLPSYCYFLHSRNYLVLPSCFSMFLERATLRRGPAPSPVLVFCVHLALCSSNDFFQRANFLSLYEKPLLHPSFGYYPNFLSPFLSTSLQSALYAVNFSSSPTVICLLHPSLLKLFSSKVSSDLLNAKRNTFTSLCYRNHLL